MPDALLNPKTVAVIGAGPVGLAAAAHLLERGLAPVLIEAGPTVGHAVRQWGHVQTFSPWQFNIDQAASRLLTREGWNKPQADHYPTGDELVDQYLTPLATRTALRDHVRTDSKVVAIGRVGFDKVKTKGREAAPFEIHLQSGSGQRKLLADAVIDASGTWFAPNPAGANGLLAVGECDARDRIAYGMPDVRGRDRERYAGRSVAVLGSGHSAIGTLIELARLKEEVPSTEVVWLLRSTDPAKSFGGGSADQLKVRGALGFLFAALVTSGKIRSETGFAVGHIGRDGDNLRIAADSACCGRTVTVNELVVSTGFRPELDFLRELRLSLDPSLECPPILAPLIDPNEHSCGSVRPHGARELAQPEAGFYFAGMKSYGRAPTFLMMTGYEQVRSIAAELAGDHEVARKVELVLPETGVCNGPPASASAVDASACCAPSEAPAATGSACCAPVSPAQPVNGCCSPKAST